MRCFISVDVEEEPVLSNIVSVMSELSTVKADVKFVERENLHFTLKFLGEISPNLIDRIYSAMLNVKHEPFTIRIGGLGAFPKPSSPRVVWLGVLEGGEKMVELYEKLERELVKVGFKREREKFVPHLTIARVKSPRSRGLLAKKILELSGVEVGELKVDSVRLKQSILTPKGPIYKTLREVKL